MSTQYGELLRSASRHLAAASVTLEIGRFTGPRDARQAAVAYRDLLAALGSHGGQLLGSPVRLAGISASAQPEPHNLVAAELLNELARIGVRNQVNDLGSAPVARAWSDAAAQLRAATDLVATHRDPGGGWRSPQAQHLDDPRVRAEGFAELGALTVPVAAAASMLGGRARQAGLSWAEVDDLVPDTDRLAEVARRARQLGGRLATASPLDRLGVANPPVRTGEPLVELGDRLGRLHRLAWHLTRAEQPGILTLADFAVAGVLVHQQATTLWQPPTDRLPSAAGEPPAPAVWTPFTGGAAAWRLVHLQIRQLRTPNPASVKVRAEVVAIRDLLTHVVGEARSNPHDPRSRQLQGVLVGAVRGFSDIATWNRQVFDDLGRNNQIFIPGRYLSGNEVSNRLDLVEVKLNDTIMAATAQHQYPTAAAYDTALTASQALRSERIAPPSPGEGIDPIREW